MDDYEILVHYAAPTNGELDRRCRAQSAMLLNFKGDRTTILRTHNGQIDSAEESSYHGSLHHAGMTIPSPDALMHRESCHFRNERAISQSLKTHERVPQSQNSTEAPDELPPRALSAGITSPNQVSLEPHHQEAHHVHTPVTKIPKTASDSFPTPSWFDTFAPDLLQTPEPSRPRTAPESLAHARSSDIVPDTFKGTKTGLHRTFSTPGKDDMVLEMEKVTKAKSGRLNYLDHQSLGHSKKSWNFIKSRGTLATDTTQRQLLQFDVESSSALSRNAAGPLTSTCHNKRRKLNHYRSDPNTVPSRKDLQSYLNPSSSATSTVDLKASQQPAASDDPETTAESTSTDTPSQKFELPSSNACVSPSESSNELLSNSRTIDLTSPTSSHDNSWLKRTTSQPTQYTHSGQVTTKDRGLDNFCSRPPSAYTVSKHQAEKSLAISRSSIQASPKVTLQWRLSNLPTVLLPDWQTMPSHPTSSTLTPSLSHLASILPIRTFFRPVFISRKIEKAERGYWHLSLTIVEDSQTHDDPQIWRESQFKYLWAALERHITCGRSGWWVRVFREVPDSDLVEDVHIRLKITTSGEVIPHIWLMCWVLSDLRIGKMGMEWRDADERPVVQMAGKGEGRETFGRREGTASWG